MGRELELHDTREEGRNPGQPDFLSEYKSQANRSWGRLYWAQGSCPTNGVRGGLGSETKLKGGGTVDSSQGPVSHEGSVDDKGPRILVTNSRGTLVNHHSCDMGTPRQELKTGSSALPDIKIDDTYCKGLSEEALRAETAQAR